MCISPIILVNREKSNVRTSQGPAYKNSDRGKWTQSLTDRVPCGTCFECIRKYKQGWVFRMQEERKASISSAFITLTYDDNHLDFSKNGYPTVKVDSWQKFMKKLRKENQKFYGSKKYETPKLSYYACAEYGDLTHRPHYHMCIFNLPTNWLQEGQRLTSGPIYEKWNKGHISISPAEDQRLAYCVGYTGKKVYKKAQQLLNNEHFSGHDDRTPEFNQMSKGIGKDYLKPNTILHHKKHKTGIIHKQDGYTIAMPRYYRDKIFTKYENYLVSEHQKKFLLQDVDPDNTDLEFSKKMLGIRHYKRKYQQSRNIL